MIFFQSFCQLNVALLSFVWVFTTAASAPKQKTPITPQEKSTFKEPDVFAGLKWGASPEEFLKLFNGYDEKLDGRERSFKAIHTIGGTGIEGTFRFLDEKFAQLCLSFPGRMFSQTSDAYLEKYGPPTAGVGANRIWSGPNVGIILAPMVMGGELVSLSCLSMHSYSAYSAEEKKSKSREAAKDL